MSHFQVITAMLTTSADEPSLWLWPECHRGWWLKWRVIELLNNESKYQVALIVLLRPASKCPLLNQACDVCRCHRPRRHSRTSVCPSPARITCTWSTMPALCLPRQLLMLPQGDLGQGQGLSGATREALVVRWHSSKGGWRGSQTGWKGQYLISNCLYFQKLYIVLWLPSGW